MVSKKRVLPFVQDDKFCGGAGGGIVFRTILNRLPLWYPALTGSASVKAGAPRFVVVRAVKARPPDIVFSGV